MKGCVMSIVDDKLAILAKKNADFSNVSSCSFTCHPSIKRKLFYSVLSDSYSILTHDILILRKKEPVLIVVICSVHQVKYREKFEKAKGQYKTVLDTPTNLHAKSVRILASEVRSRKHQKHDNYRYLLCNVYYCQ